MERGLENSDLIVLCLFDLFVVNLSDVRQNYNAILQVVSGCLIVVILVLVKVLVSAGCGNGYGQQCGKHKRGCGYYKKDCDCFST